MAGFTVLCCSQRQLHVRVPHGVVTLLCPVVLRGVVYFSSNANFLCWGALTSNPDESCNKFANDNGAHTRPVCPYNGCENRGKRCRCVAGAATGIVAVDCPSLQTSPGL